jgi:hypothetical protein
MLGSLLNYTYTPMGARLLRTNILAPITCVYAVFLYSCRALMSLLNIAQASIEARLDVVDGMARILIRPLLTVAAEIIQNEDRYTSIKEALKGVNKMDIDKLIVSVRCTLLYSRVLAVFIRPACFIRVSTYHQRQDRICSCYPDAQPTCSYQDDAHDQACAPRIPLSPSEDRSGGEF